MPRSFLLENLTFTGPCGVSTIHLPFDFLMDRQNILAHFGRFSGFETNSYTLFRSQLMATLSVLDFNNAAIFQPLLKSALGVGSCEEIDAANGGTERAYGNPKK